MEWYINLLLNSGVNEYVASWIAGIASLLVIVTVLNAFVAIFKD